MKNKVAVITGASGHVGRSICCKLAQLNIDIVLVDKDLKAGQNFSEKLSTEYNISSLFIEADLLQENSFCYIEECINEKFDHIDFLVNNAAFYDDIPGWGVSFDKEGYEAWLSVMRVNLLAPFFLTQILSKRMRNSDRASIVNIGSIYGLVGPDHSLYEGTEMTNPAAYAASKGGLLQTTRWLSTVLAPKIRVNMVSPGGIERGQLETFKERYHKRTPLQTMAKEDDVSAAVAFLLSSESQYITGQNIVVDGGWTVW